MELKEQRFLASLYATANENGERDMETQSDPKFDEEDSAVTLQELNAAIDGAAPEMSGVYKTLGSRPITVEEIDALHTRFDDEETRRQAAITALCLLNVDTLHRLFADMFGRLDNERVVSLILERVCNLQADNIGRVAALALQLLVNQFTNAKAAADAARERQRAAEVAIINALGDNAVFAVGVEE